MCLFDGCSCLHKQGWITERLTRAAAGGEIGHAQELGAASRFPSIPAAVYILLTADGAIHHHGGHEQTHSPMLEEIVSSRHLRHSSGIEWVRALPIGLCRQGWVSAGVTGC